MFETLLVRGGELVAVEEHVDRLAASAAELYGLALDRAKLADDLRERVARRCPTVSSARVVLRPDGALTAETAPLPDASAPLTLAPVVVPGGLGAHKWRDRRLVDALTAAVGTATPLLVDLDGTLLEASWGNVFVVDGDGALSTPPLDGRILPGVTRARTLARARDLDVPVAERAADADRAGGRARGAADERTARGRRGRPAGVSRRRAALTPAAGPARGSTTSAAGSAARRR